jgi:hypothetical protein
VLLVKQTVGVVLPLQYKGPTQAAALLPTESAYAVHAATAELSV